MTVVGLDVGVVLLGKSVVTFDILLVVSGPDQGLEGVPLAPARLHDLVDLRLLNNRWFLMAFHLLPHLVPELAVSYPGGAESVSMVSQGLYCI